MLKDWKTTLSGTIAALPQLGLLFHLPIPAPVLNGITTLGLFLLGLFASDGTTKPS